MKPWEKYTTGPQEPQQTTAAAQPAAVLIATSDDGGEFFELGDGSVVFRSPNYATSNPEQVKKLLKGAKPAAVAKSRANEDIIAQRPGFARAAKAFEGVPFLGTYGDEIAGALYGDDARDAMRASSRAMQEERPKESLGLQLGGGLLATLPAILASPGIAANSLGGNMVRGGLLGMGEGFTRGVGRGEGGAANRLATGGTDMAVGGVVGAAVPALAHGVGAVYRAGANALNESRGIGREAARQGISKDAGRVVARIIDKDNPDNIRATLDRIGPNAMLADASPSAMGQLNTAMRSPGEAIRTASSRIDDRATQSYYGLMDAIDPTQGPRLPPVAAQRAIAAQAKPGVSAAYTKAYGTPIDYADATGRKIEDIVSRIPERTAQKAIQKARDRMIYCLLYTSPSPRDKRQSRMPSSA